jgi:hypothetical protein
MSFRDCLQLQAAIHPSMQVQDLIKLCYQAAFGAAHILSDASAAKAAFREEFLSVPVGGSRLYEWISPDVCRVNFSVWKKNHLPPKWLFNLFILSASKASDGNKTFQQNLQEVQSLIAAGALPVSEEDWDKGLRAYEAGGVHPVHHSSCYRKEEKPAYRVVSGCFVRLFPLLQKMASIPVHEQAGVVAIDGRAASGKTTAARRLAEITGAGVVHMDDFFLPPELRTTERFSQPGGNVHYERFLTEIVPHLRSPQPFSYRRFDCSKMDYGELCHVKSAEWHIVEGSYSEHPSLGDYMDIRVFMNIDSKNQMERIRKRNGDKAAELFASRWIPLEETYFRACQIQEKAEIFL